MGSVRRLKLQAYWPSFTDRTKPFKNRAMYATVGDNPLDQKVEMTNWEKVSSMAEIDKDSLLILFRATISTTSKQFLPRSKEQGFFRASGWKLSNARELTMAQEDVRKPCHSTKAT